MSPKKSNSVLDNARKDAQRAADFYQSIVDQQIDYSRALLVCEHFGKDGTGYKKWLDRSIQHLENSRNKLDELMDKYLALGGLVPIFVHSRHF
ncbi:MAG: hypothetical protein JSR83_07405 [Proteobacteria bacterium]|nr:hypothetical protein [Pseudomonadota bacterium]